MKWDKRLSGRARRFQAWFAVVLAVLIAVPAPAMAQVSGGPGVMGPEQAGQAGQVGQPEQPATPRVPRELSAFPIITIVDPRNGAIVTRRDQGIDITYQDPRGELDLNTFQVLINGVDATRQFQVTPAEATWRPQPRGGLAAGQEATPEQQRPGIESRGARIQEAQPVLTEGQNVILASIKNVSGNMATTSAAFVLDTSTLLTTRVAPRSPLERAFLQPPSPPPTEVERRGTPTPPSVSRDLVQFGYDAFRALLPTLTPAANLPVSPDYTLGPGDSLILYVWNVPGTALFDSATLVVDRAGSVFVPRVGAVPLQGLTIAQAQEVLRTKLARYYSGFELRLALGELRGIAVYVIGEVTRPGTYTISPFSTMLDALFAAGGPTKMGTLRAIRITRSGRTLEEVDLYDFLLRGERSLGPPLQAGDTIFVPTIGPVAAIAGEVKRPGIYELRPGTSVGTLIAIAGGPLPTAQLDRVQVERVQGAAGKAILDLALGAARGGGASEPLRDGDLVTIFQAQDRLNNVVTLEGFVRAPGKYEWKPGMRLSDVLKPDVLLPEAYRNTVEVIRVRPDFTREVISVDLRELWSSNPAPNPDPNPDKDVTLQPLDRISVQSEVVGPMRVTLSGEVKRPGMYFITKGERLSSVIKRAGGFTDKAYPKAAIFTRESVRQKERVQLADFAREQETRLLAESAALAAGASDVQQATALRDNLEQRRAVLRLMVERAVLGRVILHVGDLNQLEGSESDIPLEDGDALSVPMRPSTVLVAGSVRNATAVLFQRGAPAQYYIDQAGGLTKDADKDETYILKADGSAIRGYTKVRELEPGDAILAPSSVEAKYRPLPFWTSMATVFGQFGLAAASVVTIFR
jgi:protein involved in polysaccharide export with SLBB domain